MALEDAWTYWERDLEITRRLEAGEKQRALATEFRLSVTQIRRISRKTPLRRDKLERQKFAIRQVKRLVVSGGVWTPQKQHDEFIKEMK